MKAKLYYLLSFILVSSYTSRAQLTNAEKNELFHKIDKAVGNLQTVVYTINYNMKFFARRDTIRETAICSLRVAPKDKLKAYNIVDFEYADSKKPLVFHRKYDGKKTLLITYSDSINKPIPEIITKKRDVIAVVNNYNYLLLREYWLAKKPFGRYEDAAEMIHITEETLNGKPVYVLHLKFKDTEDYRDNVEKHYIRKSDYLPVAYYSTMKWENMEQYRYYEVDYLAINPDLPVEAFTVNKEEKIDGHQRYKAFKEKL